MEKNEIIEGNKLIAEFMGATLYGNEVDFPKDKAPYDPERDSYFRVGDLKYNTSWGWLMEVVEKIESTTSGNQGYKYQVCIQNNHCKIERSDTISSDGYVYGGNKLQAVYSAVIKFIKLYNQK